MSAFGEFLDIIDNLRGPKGCPWDREQTPQTLRGHLIEETYEAVEAIDEEDTDHVREELGDVLLLLGMLSQMFSEQNDFDFSDVISEINAKLIRRHPHVFGNEKAENAADVLTHWERVKNDIEGRSREASVLDGIPGSLPPLERAWKLQKRASTSGFDWPDSQGPQKKILEELDEIHEAVQSGSQRDTEAEMGDLLFSVVNFARHIDIDPALALARTNSKFERRFRHVEANMDNDGVEMSPGNIQQMDSYWESAKGND
ncbi:MAG: nucleoside triphosphate pyrophosphohydrolase [Spirochaetaceae bacterium]|nr:nucleoside triphosphate pyrophosphohydrolase [Spirochaetaceae bacterium]